MEKLEIHVHAHVHFSYYIQIYSITPSSASSEAFKFSVKYMRRAFGAVALVVDSATEPVWGGNNQCVCIIPLPLAETSSSRFFSQWDLPLCCNIAAVVGEI